MAYVVKINNIDRTNLVRARTLSIKLDADYRDVCNLMVMTSVSGFLPRVGMPLTVTDGVDPVFSGLVSSAPMTKISALNGQDTLMAVRVEAVGFYKVAARRVVGAKYADVTAGSIVADIHTEILAAEGVTVGFIGAGADIGELDLTMQTAESALDQLARASGYKWYITHDKKLYFQETGTVTDAAHDLDETGAFQDYRNVSKREDLDQYRNRQIIIGQETEDGRIEYTKENLAEISARQAVEGGSGVYEHIISDDTIATVQAAEDLATSLLDLYGTVPIEINFDSYTVDWRPGTRLKVHMPSMGITSTRYFLIEQVDLRDLGGTLLGAVIRASSRDAMSFSTQMKEDYVSFFRQLLSSEKKAIARANEINKLSTGKMEEMLLKFNEQLAGAMGYYSTTVTQPGGAKITYQHDQPALEDSTYISYVPAPGTFAWATTGWNDGSPVWEYGVTQDGNAILNILSAYGINANWINAGKVKAQYLEIGLGADFTAGYDPSDKRRVFTSQPTPPYDVGDLWVEGSAGDIKKCKTAKAAGGSYSAADWELASKYTDDTAVSTLSGSLKDMAFENTVELAKLGTTIIQGGYIKTDLLHIGSGSSYAAGYDPSKIPYIGANYFLESGVPVTSNQYFIKTYTPFTPLTEGRQYTITATVTPAAGVTHLAPVTSNGYHGLPNMAVTGTNKQTVSITFNMVYATGRKPSDNISNANVGIYRIPNDGSVTGNTTIHQIKVEEGGKATAWVPAAEDSTEKNQLAKNLGYTDYAAMMNQAAAGKTIISGGLINTQLLTANNIITGKMSSANGKTYFDLDAAKILQQATVAGKDVRVEMSTAKPFSLQMKDALDRWQGYVYVTDASGYSGPNILVTSRYDINEDGVVDNEDVHILSKYMMKEDIAPGIPWPNGYPPFERMDLNSDGFVNTMDITMLIRESNHKPMIANINNVLGIDSDGVWYSDDWGDTKKRASTTIYGTGQNGWSNANGIRGFRSAEGIIYLSISLMAGTITTNTLVGTIGANLRPKYPIVVECYDFEYELLNNYKLVVLTNGDIRIRGASTFITGRRYEGACAYVAS